MKKYAKWADQLKDATLAFFRDQELPDELWWYEKLSPKHQRLFPHELAEALQRYLITQDAFEFVTFVDGWEGTAWLDSNPEALAAIEQSRKNRERGRTLEEWVAGTPIEDFLNDPQRRPLKYFTGGTPLGDFFASSDGAPPAQQPLRAPAHQRSKSADTHVAG